MSSPSRRFVKNIQAMRGIAVMLVLLRHATHYASLSTNYDGMGALALSGDAGVDLFFVISGFVMVTVSGSHFGDRGSMVSFLTKRALRIYPLYWIFTALRLPVKLWIVRGESPVTIWVLFSSLLLIPDVEPPLVHQGWTLIHEVYFYIVFSLFLLVSSKFLRAELVAWALVVLAGFWLVNPSQSSGHAMAVLSVIFHPLTLEFIAGCFIALLVKSPPTGALAKWLNSKAVMLATLSLSFIAIVLLGYFHPAQQPHMVRLLSFGVPAIAMIYSVVSLELNGGLVFSKKLQVVGDWSYSIYLSHILLISIVSKFWGSVGPKGPVGFWVLLLSMVAASLILGGIVHVLIERPLLGLFSSAKDPKKVTTRDSKQD